MMTLLDLATFLLLLPGSLSIPARESNWHGIPQIYTDHATVSACADTTSVKENPWTAILFYDNNFVCGATILEDDLVITAAHCVIGKRNDFFVLYYGRTIQPDTEIPDRGADQYGGATSIRAVRIHPNYDLNNKYEGSDIAVLKLKDKIHFNQLVRPIEVIPSKPKYMKMLDKGASVKVAGFGQSSGPVYGHTDRDYPTHMQMITQRIVPHQQCNRGTGPQSIGPARDVLCTRGKCGNGNNSNGTAIFKQICPGDSGSGIVGLFQEENKYYLLGVVSYIITPNQEDCGKSSKPAFSISTRDHRDFIYDDEGFPDPVNCAWGYWAEWSQCSKSCGEGIRTRRRSVETESRHGGEGCKGRYNQMEGCTISQCPSPVDCQWSNWAPWSTCSKSCGGGSMTKTRSISQQAKNGGKNCQGRNKEERKCSTNDCPSPVDCQWSNWAPWSTCSKSCGEGSMTKTRSINQQAKNGGKNCQGRNKEERKCSPNDCPPPVEEVIPQIDKSCGPGRACKTKENCPDILQKYKDIQALDRKDEKRVTVVKQLKDLVCNKKEKAFCCKGKNRTSEGLVVSTPPTVNKLPEPPTKRTQSTPRSPPVEFGNRIGAELPTNRPLAVGDWTPWSKWTPCSSTCGGGAQGRTRQCARENPLDCPQQLEQETRNCNYEPCETVSASGKICEWVTGTSPKPTEATTEATTTKYSRIRIKSSQTFTFTRRICRDRK